MTDRPYRPLYQISYRPQTDDLDGPIDVRVRLTTTGETATRTFNAAALDGGPSPDNVELADWIGAAIADLLTGGRDQRTDYRTDWSNY